MTETESDFMATVRTTLRDMSKLKTIMLKRKLRQAKAKCPECEGMLHGALAGGNNHMRFYCDGTCKRQAME
jgi:tRNA(Ile2) C34 agmatinyltransferase TiaS